MPRFTSDLVAEQREPDAPVWCETTSRRREVSPDEALAAFRQFAAGLGVSLPPEVVADGQLHRCDTLGRNGEGDATYLLHLDGLPAGGAQNWQSADGWVDWHADPGRPLSPAESANLRARAESDKMKREAARAEARQSAAEKAVAMWDKGRTDADEHPYLIRKKVKAHGTRRQERQNNLLIPMRDADGELVNLQLVDSDGAKRFLTGGIKKGCSFEIGTLVDGETIVIAEGFATGATGHEATGYPVVVTFDAGNLLPVAESVRRKYPNSPLVFLADDDREAELKKEADTGETDGNTGLVKARGAAERVGGWVALPCFGTGRTDDQSDFNDLAQVVPPAEVKRQIEAAVPWQRAPTRSAQIEAALRGEAPEGGAEADQVGEAAAKRRKRRAPGERAEPTPKRGLPVIAYAGGRLSSATDEAERILAESDREIFQRSDFLVRIGFNEEMATAHGGKTRGPRLVRVEAMHMQERLTKHIDFQVYENGRLQVDKLPAGCRARSATAPRTLGAYTHHRRHHHGADAAGRWFNPRPARLRCRDPRALSPAGQRHLSRDPARAYLDRRSGRARQDRRAD
jgi:phage/plasmid primase-like uncharacterized protein